MEIPGGNTASVLKLIQDHDKRLPPGPIHVYSERAGGEVRYLMFHFASITLHFASQFDAAGVLS